jgi:hypothetical protein
VEDFDQDAVDSLMGELEGSEGDKTPKDITEEGASELDMGEDTGESNSYQEEESSARGYSFDPDENSPNDPVPFVDFIPNLSRTLPDSLDDRIGCLLEDLNFNLKELERLKMAYAEQKNINKSYYNMWVEDSNNIFQAAVRVRLRQDRLKKTTS